MFDKPLGAVLCSRRTLCKMGWNDGVGEIDLDAIWRVAVKESFCGRPGLRIGIWEHEMKTRNDRRTPACQEDL